MYIKVAPIRFTKTEPTRLSSDNLSVPQRGEHQYSVIDPDQERKKQSIVLSC
jgi:hypothetical protein